MIEAILLVIIILGFIVISLYAVVQARRKNEEKAIKCISCNKEFMGKYKLTFLGFKKYTCPECNHKNLYPLSKPYIILYWFIMVNFIMGIGLIFLFPQPQGETPAILLPAIIAGFSLNALIKNRKIKRSSPVGFNNKGETK